MDFVDLGLRGLTEGSAMTVIVNDAEYIVVNSHLPYSFLKMNRFWDTKSTYDMV